MINSESFNNTLGLIPISNTNKSTTSYYIKYKNTVKIALNRFLETFYQGTNKERKIKQVYTEFYTGSLKNELYLVYHDNIA